MLSIFSHSPSFIPSFSRHFFFPHLVDLQMTLARPATKSCIERLPNGNVNALTQQKKNNKKNVKTNYNKKNQSYLNQSKAWFVLFSFLLAFILRFPFDFNSRSAVFPFIAIISFHCSKISEAIFLSLFLRWIFLFVFDMRSQNWEKGTQKSITRYICVCMSFVLFWLKVLLFMFLHIIFVLSSKRAQVLFHAILPMPL